MSRLVISCPLAPGSGAEVRELLEEGPPFDLEASSLDRHEVFLTGDELIFVFEGPRAREEAERLMASPEVLDRAGRLGAHMTGSPRLPEEVYSWERPEALEGLNFGSTPGPGDSDGGSSE